MSLSTGLRAVLALGLAAAIWGVSFVIIKDAYSDISPILMLAIRFCSAALLMPLLAWRAIVRTRPSRFTFRGGAATGFILGFGMILQMLGLQETSPSNSGFLTSLYIVLVPFVTFFVYQHRIEWREIWAILLAALGIALLTLTPGTLSLNRGDLLTILSSVVFAFQVVFVQRFASAGQDAWIAWLQVAFCGLVCAASIPLGIEQPTLVWSPRLIWALAFTTLGATVLAFFLQSWGQKHVSAAKAALVFATEPIFAGLASTIVLGETWSARRLCGAALVLAAVVVSELRSTDLKPEPHSEHISN